MHLAPEPPRSWLAADPIWLGSALENPDLLSMHRVSRRVNNARNDVSDCVAALLVPQNSASRNARAAPGIETCCFRYACGSRRAASVWTPSVRPKFQRDQSLGGPASKYRSVLATYIASMPATARATTRSASPPSRTRTPSTRGCAGTTRLSDLSMTATWHEIAATSLVPCFGSLSRYHFGVVALLGLFLRHGYSGAVTVRVTDSALTPRSTTPNRWVGFPPRAFWRTPCTDRFCSWRTETCVRHSSMHRR